MADYKAVDVDQLESDLTIVADAIREKGGTSEQLEFPNGMADAVRGIQSGGNEDVDTLKKQFIVRKSLIEISIPNGVTSIGHSAFRGCTELEKVVFNQEVKSLLHSAFALCYKLSFSELPDSIETFGESAFQSAKFVNKLVKLPNSLNTIDATVFQYCLGVQIKEIPPNVTSIGKQSFHACNELTELTFKGTPMSIANNAFQYCNNLTVINVPWAEGAVANAPWGATNATINYNYTEG